MVALAGAAAAHERFVVQGDSMAPTLLAGEHLLVRRWPRRVRAGALVVLRDPVGAGRLVVKRVATVTPDGVSALGDNPAASTDSRHYGPVPVGAVRGRVVYRYAPAERAGRLGRPPARRP